jgi:hypothetical protein
MDDSQVVLSIMRAMREWCKQFRKKESVMTTTTTTQQSREGTTSQKRKTKNLPVVERGAEISFWTVSLRETLFSELRN